MADKATAIFLLLFQVFISVMYGFFTEYAPDSKGPPSTYAMFQDVHVMVFLGFGFIMSFLKKYGFSAVGFNFLLSATVIEWGILCSGIFEDHKIQISLLSIIKADIIAAVTLVSMGVLLGKTTPFQLLVMGLVEAVLFVCNEHIVTEILDVTDSGGSVTLHVFGTYFGVGVAIVLGVPKTKTLQASSYMSDLFAMLGSLLLFAFWPSFTAVVSHDQNKAIINTYISIAASCISAFAFSSMVNKDNKFNMVHIQNGGLAGGVAIGSAVDLLIHPYGAAIVGTIAGIISVMGFTYLQPWMEKKLRIHDSCGVHNLHGLPGILGGIASAIVACFAEESNYGTRLFEIFPARHTRSAIGQGAYQLFGLLISILLPLVAGILTGFVLKILSQLSSAPENYTFDDSIHWEHEEEEEAPLINMTNNKSDRELVVNNEFQIM